MCHDLVTIDHLDTDIHLLIDKIQGLILDHQVNMMQPVRAVRPSVMPPGSMMPGVRGLGPGQTGGQQPAFPGPPPPSPSSATQAQQHVAPQAGHTSMPPPNIIPFPFRAAFGAMFPG